MKLLVMFAVLASFSSVAAGQNSIVDRKAREFAGAIRMGIDPVEVGIVPALTPAQTDQLKALRTCQVFKSHVSTASSVMLVWTCASGRKKTSYTTELVLEEGTITSVLVQKAIRRTQVEH